MNASILRAMTSIRWACNYTKWQPSKLEWIRAAQCIQPEEKDRIGRFVFKKDAKSSMVGRLMLRRVIHHVTKIPYGEIRLARTDKGKPCLENSLPSPLQQFSFNVSHQGDLVVLAAETDCEVGIDVMNTDVPRAKSVSEFFHTMRRQFTDGEWKIIRSHKSESDQLKTFYRLWCLKESYVKALGVGIGFEVNRLDFNISDALVPDSTTISATSLVLDGQRQPDWLFEETCIDDHSIAVAVHCNGLDRSSDAQTGFDLFSVDELVREMPCLYAVDEGYGQIFINREERPGQPHHKRNDT